MAYVKKCEKCGHVDQRASWSSAEAAAKDPQFDAWTCPMCAWTEFDLIEAEEQPVTS
jgi:predicted nucleic-acid-binding Zn-ribbon protein